MGSAVNGIDKLIKEMQGLKNSVDGLMKLSPFQGIIDQSMLTNKLLGTMNTNMANFISEIRNVSSAPIREINQEIEKTPQKIGMAEQDVLNLAEKLKEAEKQCRAFGDTSKANKLKEMLKMINVETIDVKGSMNELRQYIEKTFGTDALKQFDKELKNIDKTTNNVSKKSNFGSSLKTALGIGTVALGIRKVAGFFKEANAEAVNFAETVNLFDVSMGKGVEGLNQYYEKAIAFQEKLSDKLAVNINESMNYQALFNSMSKSMGITADKAYLLSENFTKLGYDLASLYNKDTKTSMEQLQQALSGRTEGIRKNFGIDVTEGTLKYELEILGIDRNVKELSQAEKAILRYISVLRQTTPAHGDFANTMNSASNQIKVFNAQVTAFKRNIGSLWQGLLGNILPYVNAIMMVINELLKMVAKLFNIKVWEQPSISASVGVDDLADDLGTATGKAKELKKQLMGFDEINNITLPDNSSGGSGGGASVGGIDQRLLDAMKEYDNMMDKVKSKASDIRDKMMEWLGFHRTDDGWKLNEGLTNIEKILEVAKGIGIAIASWKVSSTIAKLLSSLGIVDGKNALQFATGLTLTLTGAWFLWNGTKHLMDKNWDLFTILETIFGAGATTIGIASMLKSSFLGKTLSWGKAIAIGLGITFAIQGFEVLKEGFEKNDLKKKILGALELSTGIVLPIAINFTGIANTFSSITSKLKGLANSTEETTSKFASLAGTVGKVTLGIAGLSGAILSLESSYKNAKSFKENGGGFLETFGKVIGNALGTAGSGAMLGGAIGGVPGAILGAVGGGVASLTTTLIGLHKETEKVPEDINKSSEAIKKLNQIYEECSGVYSQIISQQKEIRENIDNTYGSRMSEISGIEALSKSLDGMIDSNGKVISGYENRVDVILNELSKATGIELGRNGDIITKNDKVVKSYKEIQKAINDTIADMKKQAKIDYLSESYKKSIGFLETAYTDAEKLQGRINEAQSELQNLVDAGVSKEDERYKTAYNNVKELQGQYTDLQGEIEKANTFVNDFEYNMLGVSAELTEQQAEELDKRNKNLEQELGRSLTIQEETNNQRKLLAEEDLQSQIAEYDKADSETRKHLLEQITIVNALNPEVVKRWGTLSRESAEAFKLEIQNVPVETRIQLLKSIQETEGLTDIVAEAWGDLAYEDIDAFRKELSNAPVETQAQILSSIAKVNGFSSDMAFSWSELAKNNVEVYNQQLSQVPEDTRKQIEEAVARVQNTEQAMKNAVNLITKPFNWFKETSFGQDGTRIITEFKAGMEEKKSLIESTVGGIANAVTSVLGRIDTKGIGSNIIAGLSTGINSAKKRVNEAISNLTNGMPKIMKNLLGIKSPSRVMRDTVGKYIPLGIAKGIDDNADSVFNSMTNLVKDIRVNPDDFKIDTNQFIDYGQISGAIATQSSVQVSSNLPQQVKEAVIEGMRNSKIKVEVEGKADKDAIFKVVQAGADEYYMQTGEPAFN